MDVVTYALAKKMVSSVSSGITEVQTDGTNIRFKTANGDWFSVRLNSVDNATVSANGHLIIELTDGTTLDAGALPVGTMDSALSTTSENGVQNKVITTALNGKQNTLTASTGITIDNTDPTNPTISANVDYTNLINKPTKLSDFTNDEDFIDNTINNLTNYYLKTETYTQTEVNNLISQLTSLSVEIVEELPSTDISTTTIYLINVSGTNNYNQWMYINNAWANIGSTSVDLTNYYTKTQTNTLLNDKVDKVSGKGLSTNDFTNAYKSILDNYTVDSTLDSTSTNPIQNGTVTDALNTKQPKTLSSPIAGASTVEGAIAQNTSDIEKIKAYTAVSNTDANTLTATGLYYLTTGCTNIPSAYCILQVQSKNTTSISDDIAQYTVNTEGDQYSRVRVNGTWSTWQKLATTSDTDYFYQTSDVEGEYDANDFAVIGKITRYCVKSPVHGYQVGGTSWWGFYETARFRDGGYGYQTFRTMLGSPVMAIRQFYGGNWTEWKQLATTDNISDYVRNNVFYVGDRRNIIGWADLSNSVDIDGSSNYANNIGRIEGRNAIIEVSNPNIGYQWPVTNSGDSNKFMDFGGAIQFFVDKVNNHLYVRFADSVDMSAWGEIATKQDLGYAKFPTIVTNSTQAIKITRNSVNSGTGRYIDVFGNVFIICIGDQSNRFYVSKVTSSINSDITTFARDMSAMYIYSNTYQLYFVELLGDLSYEVIAKSAIPSGAETVTIQ